MNLIHLHLVMGPGHMTLVVKRAYVNSTHYFNINILDIWTSHNWSDYLVESCCRI